MANNIRVGKLDFQDIKDSLKLYLSQQTEFTDYDFEGSGISQIINLLAYNSHYDALAANFLANEMFLDTAVKRSSVVSRAKELGYTPRSRRAPRCTASLTISGVANEEVIESMVVPAGTRFSTIVNEESFTFSTLVPHTLTKITEGGITKFRGNVTIYEGILIQQVKQYNSVDKTITIDNLDIDTSTLKVEVIEGNLNWREFVSPANFLSVTDTSNIYMLQEGFSGFEIYFGDGTFGVNPANGSGVRLTYMVTSGPAANSAARFLLTSSIAGVLPSSVITITPATPAQGGMLEESIDSIKSNAVLQYGSQNRCVVAKDYAAMAKQHFPEVKDCLAWDGSDHIPPRFGKVILCIQPLMGDSLTIAQKEAITSYLQSKGVANTKVDLVEPEYVDVAVTTTVRYDPNTLTIGTYELEYTTKLAIANFASVNIYKFGSKLRYSSLMSAIDNANYAIAGNLTKLQLLKNIVPNLYASNTFVFSFSNQIDPGTLLSTVFYQSTTPNRLYLKDNGRGIINIAYDFNGTELIYKQNVGTVDYNTGMVNISNLEMSSVESLKFVISATPTEYDLVSKNNIILNLAVNNIKITTLADNT